MPKPLTNPMVKIELSDLEITDDDLHQYQEAWDAKILELKHPYVLDLIRVLVPYKRPLRRMTVIALLRSSRTTLGLPMPPMFDHAVQRTLEYHCVDSDVFKDRKVAHSEALFCWPRGNGKGIWGLIPENAEVWVRQNREFWSRRVIKI
jgi:hypothetical protein